MKARITDRDARDCVSYSIGYCDAQYLLRAYSPVFYTAWVYGRKSDIYNINGVYVATGYGPVGPELDYNKTREYDKKAEKIRANRNWKRETRQKKVEKLLNELLENA